MSSETPCHARRPGIKTPFEQAEIVAELPKSKLRVRFLSDGRTMDLSAARVLRRTQRTPTPPLQPPAHTAQPLVAVSAAPPTRQPVPKPPSCPPLPAYVAFVRTLACVNCGERPPSDPHHEGRRGVGQKVRDTLTVPLCRACHRYYTDTNCLPVIGRTPATPRVVVGPRSRGDSLRILREGIEQALLTLISAIPLEERVERLSLFVADLGPLLDDALEAVRRGL